MGFENLEMLGTSDDLKKRVADLSKGNSKGEDPVYDLAEVEDKKRAKLKKDPENLSQEFIDRYSDEHSTEALVGMEKRKELTKELAEAKREAWMDELTGLKNRKALKNGMAEVLSLLKREEKDCSLLMIDIDKFKKINDTYGHPIGDKVLVKVAEIIKKSLRLGDFAYRYGGEEFAVMLINTDMEKAGKAAERVREMVSREMADVIEGNKITISVGYSNTINISEWEKSQKEISMDDIKAYLIDQADKALYISKNSGRDKVTAYAKTLSGEVATVNLEISQ